jgi:hypothetical protein
MRAYTLSILNKLSPSGKTIQDADIIAWVNSTLSGAGKASHIVSFKDSSNASSLPVIDLVDAIRPGAVDYSLVFGRDGARLSESDKTKNAKYAISMARKIGAGVYALPEDLVEVKQKMVMTIYACLMAASFKA